MVGGRKKWGELSYSEGPDTIHCWAGTIKGSREGFAVILNTPDLSGAEGELISRVTENWQAYVKKAKCLIKATLEKQPELLGLANEEAAVYLAADELPVDQPRFLFYEGEQWTLHFLECAFPIGEPFGLGVGFVGEWPTTIEDLSDAEMIDEEGLDA